jgi:hypothetical protein
LRQPADLLEGHRADAAAVCVDFEGTGPGLGAGAAADRAGDDVRRRHAEKVFAALVGAVGLLAALFLVDVLFAPPGWWQISMQPITSATGCWFILAGLHRLCSAERHPGGTATPASTATGRRIQRPAGVDLRRLRRADGQGLAAGTRMPSGYLPRAVAHNDFIFSVIAEEEGFVGSVIVLTLYAVVLFTGLRIAGQARDRLGKLLAVGVVTLIFSHVFINIGMNIRIMPVTGVPLPLLSYGGSSVLAR